MALNHEQPDRPPLDFGGLVTAPTYGAYENMKKYFNLKDPKAEIGGFKVMINMDEELLQRSRIYQEVYYSQTKGGDDNG